jgi:hypothetical protein
VYSVGVWVGMTCIRLDKGNESINQLLIALLLSSRPE